MFVKATKAQARLRMGLVAVSGAGKTYTALSIAETLKGSGRIAVVDTEHGSASKYSGIFDFDVCNLERFSPKDYIDLITEAEEGGKHTVLILDSITHLWEGVGGELEMVDAAAKRSKSNNSFMAWKEVTPLHRRFIDKILQCKLHVICTMRAKTEYLVETDERGRVKPKKIGTKPIQREGMEYEFDVVGDIDQEHNLIITKTRCPEIDAAVINKPGKEFAQTLLKWLTDGTPAPVKEAPKKKEAPRTAAAATPAKVPNLPTIAAEPTPAAVSTTTVAPEQEPENETQETPADKPVQVTSFTSAEELKAIIREFQGPPAKASAETVKECYPQGCTGFKDVPPLEYDNVVLAIRDAYDASSHFKPPIITAHLKKLPPF